MKKRLLFIAVPIFLILTGFIMDKKRDKIWFQKSTTINCNIKDIDKSLENLGNHYKQIMDKYPGMINVELIEAGEDFVTIKTNEGLMKRTNFSISKSEGKILVEFDEEYITRQLTTYSHFEERFEGKNNEVELNIKISNIVAPGFLGFLLRNFGGNNIGKAFLNSYKQTFEK